MITKVLDKSNILSLVKGLMANYDVVAPVKKEKFFVFDVLETENDIELDYPTTILPPKKYFLPQRESLFKFEKNDEFKISDKLPKTNFLIFGMHPCDVNALLYLDKVYAEEYKDNFYLARRKNNVIVAVNCTSPGEFCFCKSVNAHKITGGCDLLLSDIGDKYLVEVKTPKGREVAGRKEFEKFTKKIPTMEEPIFKTKIRIEGLEEKLATTFYSDLWKKYSDKCLSCGNCTNVCPTCFCFDVKDEVDLSLKKGERKRVWDSCQLLDFTKVAGGLIFRRDRHERFKHRIYHKFNYSLERYQICGCVGCGRCIETCPTDINMLEIFENLEV
jgi:sulfhydrogenase subunit beta (sulfur reductase)